MFGGIRASVLVRIIVVYAGASWIVLEVVSTFGDEFGLPSWFFPAALGLLLLGLPIILATAMVQAELRREPEQESVPGLEFERVPDLQPAAAVPAALAAHPVSRWLTWSRSIMGGVLAFAILAIIGGIIVMRGSARVTEAYGAAGDEFGERAWLVVADFGTPTEEPDLGVAVREALTVDLQQSKYVNVYTRSQMSGALRLMEVSDTFVTEELGRQIAQREGLAAVLVGSVSKLGDNYVLAARVLRPADGEELLAVRSTAAGSYMVDAVEVLSREIRARLGESGSALSDSRSLPQVTTRSLEALQRYAQAVTATQRGNGEQALVLAEASIDLDPDFAMAHRLAGVNHFNAGRTSEGRRSTTQAYDLRHKLSDRERLHIEALHAWNVVDDPVQAIAKYELILSAYPDDSRATNNLAAVANAVGDHERGYSAALRAIELNPYLVQGYYNAINPALVAGEWAVVDSLIDLGFSNGLTDWITRARIWWSDVVAGDWARIDFVCDSLLSNTPQHGGARPWNETVCGGHDAARGRIARAVERLDRGAAIFAERGTHVTHYQAVSFAVQADMIRGKPGGAQARLDRSLASSPLDSVPKPDWFEAIWWAASAAAQAGDLPTARRLAAIQAVDTTTWSEAAFWLRLQSVVALAEGEYQEALSFSRRGVSRDFGRLLVYDQLTRAQAFDGLQQQDSAVALYERVADLRSLADKYGLETTFYSIHLPLVHRRLGEIYTELGEPAKAAEHYEAFLGLWSDPDPELQPQVEAVRRALERLGAEARAPTSGP